MTQVTEAVYTHGVLRPTTELRLQEHQRVRVIVESIEEGPSDRDAALARFKAGVASTQFFSKGPLPSREELHDRS
jgi:predicted DNA-binding antitoxin AbrB/MazE fold protein